jgi:hypothetical protein
MHKGDWDCGDEGMRDRRDRRNRETNTGKFVFIII